MLPPLEPHCGSWIIVSRATGAPVLETWQASIAAKVNRAAYEVFTAAQWLGSLNGSARPCARFDGAPYYAPARLERLARRWKWSG